MPNGPIDQLVTSTVAQTGSPCHWGKRVQTGLLFAQRGHSAGTAHGVPPGGHDTQHGHDVPQFSCVTQRPNGARETGGGSVPGARVASVPHYSARALGRFRGLRRAAVFVAIALPLPSAACATALSSPCVVMFTRRVSHTASGPLRRVPGLMLRGGGGGCTPQVQNGGMAVSRQSVGGGRGEGPPRRAGDDMGLAHGAHTTRTSGQAMPVAWPRDGTTGPMV